MDPDFGPSPDPDSAVQWLKERGSFVKGRWIFKTFTPRRVQAERNKESRVLTVWGFDNKLPDPEIEKSMANHFSCCGEIVEVRIGPFYAPKSDPDRFVRITILGEGVKEKAEQLNGSELGGCKLVVHAPPPSGILIDGLSIDDLLLADIPHYRTHAEPECRLLNSEQIQAARLKRQAPPEKDEESSLKKMKLSLDKKEYQPALNKLDEETIESSLKKVKLSLEKLL